MSNNLTYKHKIVLDLGGEISYPRGYDLIIQEKNSYRILHEGMQEKKNALGFLQRKKEMKVFAISNDTNHTFPVKKLVGHNDRIHHFYTKIKFKFKVGSDNRSKETLIKKLSSDPLAKVKDEITSLICNRLKSEEWDTLLNPAKIESLQERILQVEMVKIGLDESVSPLERINTIANGYGLEVIEINFTTEIPEEFLAKETAKFQANEDIVIKDIDTEKTLITNKLDQKIKLQEQDLGEELRQGERLIELKDTTSKTLQRGIDIAGERIASGINDIEDLNKVLLDGQTTIRTLENAKKGGNTTAIDDNSSSVPLLGPGQEGNLVTSIYEVLKGFKSAKLSSKNDLKLSLAAIFYLVADTLKDADQEESQARFMESIGQVELPQGLRDLLKTQWKEIKNHIENDNLL